MSQQEATDFDSQGADIEVFFSFHTKLLAEQKKQATDENHSMSNTDVSPVWRRNRKNAQESDGKNEDSLEQSLHPPFSELMDEEGLLHTENRPKAIEFTKMLAQIEKEKILEQRRKHGLEEVSDI